MRKMSVEELLERYAAGERDFTGLDFSGGVFGRCVLNGCNFQGVNFSYAELDRVKICSCNFRDTIFFRAKLCNCMFSSSKFIGADMREVTFDGGDGMGAVFEDVDLRGAIGRFVTESSAIYRNCISKGGKFIELIDEWKIMNEISFGVGIEEEGDVSPAQNSGIEDSVVIDDDMPF